MALLQHWVTRQTLLMEVNKINHPFTIHISSRTLYILDPHPLPDEFKIQSLRKCTAIIQRVCTVLSKVMEVSCPWWKDDLILFNHRVADVSQFELNW